MIKDILKICFKKQRRIELFKIKSLRFNYVKSRYHKLKDKMVFYKNGSENIGDNTIAHNLNAFETDSAFGCGDRMGLLIYPVISFYSFEQIKKEKIKILIVGCRSEDDIVWMKSYGFSQTIGFDLFSYSEDVEVGDIHNTKFENATFDVVLLGWMISYTKSPKDVLKECRRILKVGGLLGVGIEYNPLQTDENLGKVRVNTLNSTKDIISLLDETIKEHKVLFEYDHYNDNQNDYSTAVVTICK